eukprot:30927-Pelagococcus_subviridis.AAC.6
MYFASASVFPLTSVFFTRSDPARSTRFTFALRPRGRHVHRRLRDGAVRVAQEEQVQRVLLGFATMRAQILQVKVPGVVLSHADPRQVLERFRVVLRVEQVVALVLVNFHVRHVHLVLPVRLLRDVRVQSRDGPRDDPAVGVPLDAAGYRERLPASRLPVREHGAVEPIERAGDHLRRASLEDLVLLRVRREHAVELERVLFPLIVHVPGEVVSRDVEHALVLADVDRDARRRRPDGLQPQVDLDVLPHRARRACPSASRASNWHPKKRRRRTRTTSYNKNVTLSTRTSIASYLPVQPQHQLLDRVHRRDVPVRRQPPALRRPFAHRRRRARRRLPRVRANENRGPPHRRVHGEPHAVPVSRPRRLRRRLLRRPHVQPRVPRGEVHVHPGRLAVHHRRGEDIPPHEELRRDSRRDDVVRVVHEQRARERHPRERRLPHELRAIRRQRSMQPREVPQVIEELRGVPRLRVVQRSVSLVRAEDDVRQRGELHPAHEQLPRAVSPGRRGVPADVAVRQREAAQPAL